MLCLTTQPLKTTFLWNGAWVEHGIALQLSFDSLLLLVINIFSQDLSVKFSYILLRYCEVLFISGSVS